MNGDRGDTVTGQTSDEMSQIFQIDFSSTSTPTAANTNCHMTRQMNYNTWSIDLIPTENREVVSALELEERNHANLLSAQSVINEATKSTNQNLNCTVTINRTSHSNSRENEIYRAEQESFVGWLRQPTNNCNSSGFWPPSMVRYIHCGSFICATISMLHSFVLNR